MSSALLSSPATAAGRDHARRRAPRAARGVSRTNGPADRVEIERLQLAKLRFLLKQVLARNPFYRAKLGGLDAAINDLDEFVDRCPLTTKPELVEDQLAHPPYGSNLAFPVDRYVRCHQTSGSTGVPLRWLDTAESWQHLLGNWRRIFSAAGVTSRDRFLFAFSFGPFIGFWSALESALQLGCFCFPAGSMTSPARLQALLDHRITVLASTPTYALHLGDVAHAGQIELSRSAVRLILVAGEPGGSLPATRARLTSLWPNARVIDHYGMTETGPATYECPVQPGVLHVLESAYLPEVLRPGTLTPVPAGETGELVLTTLDRLGSPLLRYRTGDLVRKGAGSACACGTHELALAGGILGRTDDMIIVRGVNVYPSAIDELVRRVGRVAEYRVNVDRRGPLTELRLEIEPEQDCENPAALARRLQQTLQNALSLRVPVQAVPSGTLPRFEMKARRWVEATR
jgi:phenylacetate-CoA ligase